MRNFKKSIGALDAEAASRLALLSSDIAVMVDREGVVKDLAICNESLSKDTDIASWIGCRWIDTVTIESRPKIEQLLKDAHAGLKPQLQWRQVNHPTGTGRADLPMRYAAVPIRPNGSIVAVGRELRSMSLLQQKLIESQQAIEREYARVRHAEMRYRLLFQVSSEGILVVDAATLRIAEANPAAQALLSPSVKRVIGKAVTDLIDGVNQLAVQRMIDALRSSGRADAVTVKLGHPKRDVAVSGSVFRQETTSQLLIKLSPLDGRALPADVTGVDTALRSLIERMPDAFVVTDTSKRILTGNAAFLSLAGLAGPDQMRGQSMDRWIGRSPAELNLLIGTLREHGFVRKFPTIVKDELGSSEGVEISAVAVEEGPQPSFGFSIRTAARQSPSDPWSPDNVQQSANRMTALVGQVPLKNLVRETTDLIERMCIEAALQIVGDNRASAAEMLGLSRQSLYIKMRRYGLGDLGTDD